MAAPAADPGQLVPFVVTQGLTTQVHRQGFPDVTQVDPWQQESLAAPAHQRAGQAQRARGQVRHQGARPDRVFGGDTSRIAELDQVAHRCPQTDLAFVPGDGLAIRSALNPGIVMTAELAGVPRVPGAVPIYYRFTAGPRQEAVSHA